jgi:hypothetical protein
MKKLIAFYKILPELSKVDKTEDYLNAAFYIKISQFSLLIVRVVD